MATLADHPDLVAQIDLERNPLDPARISDKARTRIWWRCPVAPGHRWQAYVVARAHGAGCPLCAANGSGLLSARAPEVAAEWHPTKNGALTPDAVTVGTHRKVWWKCPAAPDHEWDATINSRTQGTGCPFCAGRRVSSTNSLALCAPEVAAEWHPTKNGALRPEDVSRASGRKVWWQCPHGEDHVWQATVDARAHAGKGCPFCRGLQVSGTTSLAHLAPEIAAEWHPARNGALTADDVTARGDRRVWWQCRKNPEHEWQNGIGNRTRLGQGCPFCAGQKFLRSGSLGELHPELVSQWMVEKNLPRTPYDVGPRSGFSAWWKCPKGADHEWQAVVYTRTLPASQGCPFCSAHRVCKDNCLATRFPDVAREWHPTLNGAMTPETVTPGSNKHAWWRCQLGHVWKALIGSRTGPRRRGCPVCARGRRRPVATTARSRAAVRLPGYDGPHHGPVIRRGG